MISDKFSQSFYLFVENNKKLSRTQKDEVIFTFKNKTIQTIFSVSIYLILWSFCAAFIDTFLVTRGFVFTFLDYAFLSSFLPSLLFIITNASIKFIFIYSYTKKRIQIPIKHIFIGVIPLVGSLFFTAYLLRDKLLFFSIIKHYFIFIKKDFMWFKILRSKTS